MHEAVGDSEIAREITHLLKTHTGRGPVRARAYVHDEAVTVVMYEGHTPAEQTLHEVGADRLVGDGPYCLFRAKPDDFIEVIERHTGRKVIGFLRDSQQDPGLLAHVYVLDGRP